MNPFQNVIELLQACVTPIVIVSGVGLLLLSVTNRLGRAIDRTRELKGLIDRRHAEDDSGAQRQMAVLFRRCRILQVSVALICLTMICGGLMIPCLAIMHMARHDLSASVIALFILSVMFAIGAAVLLLLDIVLGLNALAIEVNGSSGEQA